MKHLHRYAATLVATAGIPIAALAGNFAVKTVQASQPGLQTPPQPQTKEPTLSVNSAQSLYEGNCLACHGADGKGSMPGVPDLTDANGPLTQSDGVLRIRIVNGFSSPGSAMAMPAKGGNASLTEQDIFALIGYMRAQFKPQKHL